MTERRAGEIARTGFVGWFLFALLLVALLILLLAATQLASGRKDINLPHSRSCRRIPLNVQVAVEVGSDGSAALNGRRVSGLQWPIESWEWLGHAGYFKKLFKPDMAERDKKGLYGTTVPVLLCLNRDLEFTAPRFYWLMNIWVRTENNDCSWSTGLSFCIPDPCDSMPGSGGRIWVNWHGRHFQMALTKGFLPLRVLPGGKYRVLKGSNWVELPIFGAHSTIPQYPTMKLDRLPDKAMSLEEFEELLDSVGSGVVLCVEVEKGVSVQEIVDFMILCEFMNQPWTFYFERR